MHMPIRMQIFVSLSNNTIVLFSRDLPKVTHAPKTSVHKKHPKNILWEEKHVHRYLGQTSLLSHTNVHDYATSNFQTHMKSDVPKHLKPLNSLPNAKYWILKQSPRLKFSSACLPACLHACLISFEKLEVKWCNTWSLALLQLQTHHWNVPFRVPPSAHCSSFFFFCLKDSSSSSCNKAIMRW